LDFRDQYVLAKSNGFGKDEKVGNLNLLQVGSAPMWINLDMEKNTNESGLKRIRK